MSDVDEDLYDGVPVLALPILEVDVPDPTHLRRSLRYPNATDIDPRQRSRQPSIPTA